MDQSTATSTGSASPALRYGLWAAQVFIMAMFGWVGLMKLSAPISELSQMWAWTGQLPEWFVRSLGVVDLAGGVGVLLPSVTRIMPRATVLAALGCVVLQILASCFHAYRGEFIALPVNALCLAASVFILWGRSVKVPIQPRD